MPHSRGATAKKCKTADGGWANRSGLPPKSRDKRPRRTSGRAARLRSQARGRPTGNLMTGRSLTNRAIGCDLLACGLALGGRGHEALPWVTCNLAWERRGGNSTLLQRLEHLHGARELGVVELG